MTKEERDRREAEKRARMEGSPDLGGVTLPFSRATLLTVLWGFVLLFPAWTLWNARENLTFETVFAGSVLFVACVLPSWYWCTGRVMGLPIYPIFGMSFIPTYVTPLWQGHERLDKFTFNEINLAVWTVAGFLLVGMLFWQQMAVRGIGIPGKVRMIDLKKSETILLWCLLFEVVFELLGFFFWQLGNAFSSIRGFATAAGRMGIFVFSYRLGQGELKPGTKILFIGLLGVLIIQETASLLLASVLPTIGIAFAAYTLGAGKIPWKALAAVVGLISLLHAGKYEMREIYHSGQKSSNIWDYPRYFGEWVGYGLKNLGMGKVGEEKKEDITTAKERASLIHLMVMIQTMTPSKVPYLQGATYEFIPSLLIPRILSPNKKWSHTGNMILSLHYGLLNEEGIWRTSIGFDPVMEAYANFGYVGVLALAVIMGFFLGWVTKLTINVPILSFGFLFGVLVIGTNISAWNTMGVYATSTWQSFLALLGLSLVLMGKLENPVWKYYAMKLAEKLKFKKDPKLEKTLQEVEAAVGATTGYGLQAAGNEEVRNLELRDQGGVAGSGPTSLQTSPTREELRRVEEETRPVRHERPTRFVYGDKKGK